MGNKTNISWTQATWNPVLGCSRVSEGCRFCYAETIAGRFGVTKQGKKPTVYNGLTHIVNGRSTWTGKIVETKTMLLPLRWKSSRRIFVNSMSDLFHENVTDYQRDRIFAVMAMAKQHTFQVLTKRPDRMLAYLTKGLPCSRISRAAADLMESGDIAIREGFERRSDGTVRCDGGIFDWASWPLPNVWLGVSDEGNQHHRIDILRDIPAALRFISAEPLLFDPGTLDLRGIGWIIVGGESGPHARPMLSQWADNIRHQCEVVGVPYFHKQNGEWVDAGHNEFGSGAAGKTKFLRSDGTEWDHAPEDENADVNTVKRVGKKRAGDTLYGKKYHEFPI
jgi:protein gp37